MWRVSLNLSLYLPFFLSLYLLFVLHLVCFVMVVFCLSSCLVFPFLLCFVVSFSLSDYTQKERARRVGASSLRVWVVVLDVFEHYRYFLRFIVPISNPFTGDSCNIFGLVCWVVYYLPVFVNR